MTLRRAVAAAVVAVLAGLAWLNLDWANTPPDLSPVASTAADAQRPNIARASGAAFPEVIGTADDLSESLARPLFHATRRPFVPAPAVVETAPHVEEPAAVVPDEPTPPPAALPELQLAGVSLSGGRKRALIGQAGEPNLQWVKPGDSIAGWRVDAITARAVVLASGDQRFTVALYPAHRPESASR